MEVEVGLGCGHHVEAALERGEELVRLRDDGAVDDLGHLAQPVEHQLTIVFDLNRLKDLARDGEQRFVWPAVEPVDGAAVDQRGEHAAAHAESAADGRHAEDDVQVGAHAADEEGLDVVLGGRDPSLLARLAARAWLGLGLGLGV